MLKRMYCCGNKSVKAYMINFVKRRARVEEFDFAGLFVALGDRTRVRLLNLIAGREVCVCHLVDVLGAPQPKISRHLAYLRRGGVVRGARGGTWMGHRLVGAADDDVD